MKSRYLAQLEAELAETTNPADRLILNGKMAFHFARLGKIDRVQEVVGELRKSLVQEDLSPGPTVCWINLAEGIVCHYDARKGEARSKWERSRAVADSIGLRSVSSIASAWLAFSYYLSEQLELVKRNGLAALESIDSGNFSAVSRLSLNVALCFHYTGDVSAAREWYTRCRLAAVNDGDEATLAALIHSMAWMSISTVRSQGLFKEVNYQSTDLVLVKAETVESYEMLVGAASLPALTPLLLAQECIVSGKFSKAVELIDEHFNAVSQQGFERLGPGLLADRAYCLVFLGRAAEAAVVAEQAHQLPRSMLHSDDRAILHATLAETFSELHMEHLANYHHEEARTARDSLLAFKREMAATIGVVEISARKHTAFDVGGR